MDTSNELADEERIEAAYRELPVETRKFIKSLTPAKIDKIERTIRAQEMADAFGKGSKIVFTGIVIIFGGIGTVIYGWNLILEKITSTVKP